MVGQTRDYQIASPKLQHKVDDGLGFKKSDKLVNKTTGVRKNGQEYMNSNIRQVMTGFINGTLNER